jgi:hypothetical protein
MKINDYIKVCSNHYTWMNGYIYGQIINILDKDHITMRHAKMDGYEEEYYTVLTLNKCNIEIIDKVEYNLSI